jgi:hypothetical protein
MRWRCKRWIVLGSLLMGSASALAGSKIRTTRCILLWLLVLTSAGCYSVSSYKGDGTLSDADSQAKYKLTLGDVSLATPAEQSFVLSGLPRERFTLGLEIRRLQSSPERILETKPLHSMVRIRVLNERNELVVDEEAKLSDWVWSGPLSEPDRSFVYRSGKSQETPIGGGSVRVEATEKRADEGWGSYFVPRRDGTYRMEVSFSAAENAEEYSVRIVGYGGERLWL